MKNQKILFSIMILMISITLFLLPIITAQETYPFNNSNITVIKAREILSKSFDGADGDILHERVMINYFINVSENINDLNCKSFNGYSHCNYQMFVFYDSESNKLNLANQTVRNAIKDTAMIEFNYTMNNNQILFYDYIKGDNI